MQLAALFTLSGSAVVEKLGKVQDGERIKIEFRGKSEPGSPVAGKAHGSTWVLVGPLGLSAVNAVQEIVTPAGERFVVELRGYAAAQNGGGMEIRAAGMIRTSAAAFANLNGRMALVIQTLRADDTITVQAYQF